MSKPVITADFTHAHISGLWDARDRLWRIALSQAIKAGADVITVTEFTLDPIEAPKGWTKIHFSGEGRKECAIFFDNSVWALTERWCIPISKTLYALGSGKIRPRVHLVGVELVHRASGEILNVEVYHAPSAIEGGKGLVNGVRRVKAALECFAAIRAHRRRELKGEASILAADWNLDLRKAWVRALLKTRVGLRNGWGKLPRDGTRGKRIIDGVRYTAKHVRAIGGTRLGPQTPTFDHRMVLTRFGWPAR